MTGHPALLERIRAEMARAGGQITFARFMELALYEPDLGYYATGRAAIGRAGDFFTSVSVGPLFGRILARQLRAWGVRSVTEFGSHQGQLRQDILQAMPELDYRVVEVDEALPERMTGCVLSNELLDAFPVHRVVGDREVYVDDQFREVLGPLSDPRLPRLPAGYRSEFNLRAVEWLTEIARRIEPGSYVLTIDYGFERAEYFAPHHKDGHLQSYYRHRKSGNPYEHIGGQDITAHVEFSSLMEVPGLETVLLTTQDRYLVKTGAEELATAPGQARQLLTMGPAFKVLVQRKTAIEI